MKVEYRLFELLPARFLGAQQEFTLPKHSSQIRKSRTEDDKNAELSMPDRTLKVYVTGLAKLHALARNRDKIGDAKLKTVIDAILRMAGERDNFCSNRQALLRGLMHFADVVDVGTRPSEDVTQRGHEKDAAAAGWIEDSPLENFFWGESGEAWPRAREVR